MFPYKARFYKGLHYIEHKNTKKYVSLIEKKKIKNLAKKKIKKFFLYKRVKKCVPVFRKQKKPYKPHNNGIYSGTQTGTQKKK
ncbi:MAG: hypothetical protein IK062_01090, partial [Selenomonadaceae bacterium]|nr:hypothetical protein [Selenomonadaceae bacterium]